MGREKCKYATKDWYSTCGVPQYHRNTVSGKLKMYTITPETATKKWKEPQPMRQLGDKTEWLRYT